MEEESFLDNLFCGIRKRFVELGDSPSRQQSFIEHIKTLTVWEKDGSIDENYLKNNPANFPQEIAVAQAFCRPECGTIEFIVDGCTQECQRCGGLLFRTVTRAYVLK